tara:strand:- start:16 stop:222 length:207 start_codon:yes stop_codon:yes gene_type:complete
MKKIDQIKKMIKLYTGTEITGINMELCISTDEVESLLSNYDPANPHSPDAATCRELARLILDALKSVE